MFDFIGSCKAKKTVAAALALGLMMGIAGCGKNEQPQAAAVAVKSMQVIKRDTPLVYDYTGFVEAQQEMNLVSQVSGQITGKYFNGGETVQAGQVLYSIDPRTYQANMLNAQANLVSPIVVIVISFTALCSFAIPNEEFATAFRILKFFFIAVCAWLGYFGMLLGLLAVLTHLSHLTSFGIPYLMPFVGADLNNYEDERDFIWRQPFRKLRKRPIYANPKERTKLMFSKKR